MKRFLLLLCIFCVLYGLSWAGNLGMSTEGKKANPNLAHTAKLDSAKFVFYYPYGNEYVTAYGYPDDDDSLNVVDTTVAGIDLDSIGSHHLKVTYYPHGGGSAIIYGQWVHEDPTPGDTIQRNASTHSASDVATLWGDTLNQLLVTIDSVITATGFDPDSTLLVFLQYIRNNQTDYRATGFSTFDPATDSTFPDKSHLWNLGVDMVGADAESLLSIRNYAYAIQETINTHAPHGDNWASVGAGGADLSDEVDSILTVLYDRTNDSNFVRLIAHLLLHDSVTIDKSNAWGLGVEVNTKTGFKLAQDGLDTDTSFTGLQSEVAGIKAKTDNLPSDPADDSDIDAQLSAIQTDLDNPSQYKATGFAVAGDAMTLQDDSLQTLMTDVDSVVSAIADANKANFKATGFSTFDPTSDVVVRVTYVDSAETVITQPAGGSGSDTTAIKTMHNNRGTSTFDPAIDTVIWVDTVLYAGAAQKNTEAEITGWVKATLEDTSNIARDATKDNYKGGLCGSGTEEVKIKAYEADVDSGACENCEVKIYLIEDSDYSDEKVRATSNSAGFTDLLSLDADSYAVVIAQPAWTFDLDTISVLDVDTLVTFYITGTHHEIPAPQSDSTTVIFGYVKDAGGNYVQDAIVTIKLDMREPIIPTWTGSNDIVITELVTTTDASGAWNKEVVPNEYISPSGTRYIVTYEKEGVILEVWKLIVTVPYSETPLNINDL